MLPILPSESTWLEIHKLNPEDAPFKTYILYSTLYEKAKELELVRDILKEEVEKLEARVKELEAK